VIQYDEEHRIKNSLLIDFGLTLVLQTLAIQFWTADERSVIPPYAREGLEIAGIRFPYVRLAGLVIGIVLVIGLQLFFKRTYWGKAIRATAENWQTASLTGINVRRMYIWTFSLGAALAGLAGTLVVVGFSVYPSVGLQWTLKALIVVVMAGLGSVPGTFLAGILLGVAESGGAAIFGGQYRELISLFIFLAILLLRPQGLFGGRANG
jgi:branched-chain amino acid transport system permease protein